jgi:hypothetical protein
MDSGRKPNLVVNPIDDGDFVVAAERLIDEGIVSLGEFVRRLQPTYPDVAVHPREIYAEPVLIWYVYRDGHWVNIAPAPAQLGVHTQDDRSTRRSSRNRAGDPPRR